MTRAANLRQSHRDAVFGRRVAADLRLDGYAVAWPVPRSRNVLLATKGERPLVEAIWVFCRRNGRLTRQEQNQLTDWAKLIGAIPVVAYAKPFAHAPRFVTLAAADHGRDYQTDRAA